MKNGSDPGPSGAGLGARPSRVHSALLQVLRAGETRRVDTRSPLLIGAVHSLALNADVTVALDEGEPLYRAMLDHARCRKKPLLVGSPAHEAASFGCLSIAIVLWDVGTVLLPQYRLAEVEDRWWAIGQEREPLIAFGPEGLTPTYRQPWSSEAGRLQALNAAQQTLERIMRKTPG